MSVKSLIEDHIQKADRELAAFQERFQKSPHAAFSWGNDALAAASSKHVFTEALRVLEKVGVDKLEESARYEVRRITSAGMVRSTGVLEGPLRAEEVRAWTEVLNFIEWQREE